MEIINNLLDPDYGATKSYSDLLAEGIAHKGGLAMLAAAKKVAHSHPSIAALLFRVAHGT
ncbi:MAG: hypothetical protein ACXWCP_30265 [Burkholderiales bacterium]